MATQREIVTEGVVVEVIEVFGQALTKDLYHRQESAKPLDPAARRLRSAWRTPYASAIMLSAT